VRISALPRSGAEPPVGETCFGPQQSGMVKGAEVVSFKFYSVNLYGTVHTKPKRQAYLISELNMVTHASQRSHKPESA